MIFSVEQKKALKDHFSKNIGVDTLKTMLGFNIENNQIFGFEMLKLAGFNKNEYALILGIFYIIIDNQDVDDKIFSFIKKIYFSEWHHEHENILSIFSKKISCKYIDFLYEAIIFVPQYLVCFEERSIARRAFFGLGRNISCPKALEYLNQFLNDPDANSKGFDLMNDFEGAEFGINSLLESYVDSDDDGLPDYIERFIGSDPNNPDSDGDVMVTKMVMRINYWVQKVF